MLEKLIRNEAGLGLLLLRLTLGIIFTAHGLHKLTLWLGGEGISGTINSFTQMGISYPQVMAYVVGICELISGLAMLLGLLAREAGVLIVGLMVGAMLTVHGQHGFFIFNNGFEYNFMIIGASLCIIFSGGGMMAIDHLLFYQERWKFIKDPSRIKLEPPEE